MTKPRTVIDVIRTTYGWGPWVEWAGRMKRCPLAAGTKHQLKFRNGQTATDDSPETWEWKHHKNPGDIIAYRIQRTR